MKRYMITGAVTLNFADGRRVRIEPGIHQHPDDVAAHWAFKHHAQVLDEDQNKSEYSPAEGENQQSDTGVKVSDVEDEKDKGNGKK
ncbi:hypothetical protein PCO87_14155 [Pectobacteriaceae bacterium C52]|nr:hypothetical protein PCO87_14155 [Pectobacteriaceae bacterium C52]